MERHYEKVDFLIIEDDLDTITFLSEYLKTQGYVSKCARSVRDGQEILKDYIPSVILLDILLPDKKGYEIIVPIKSNTLFNNVLIYFLTAVPRYDAMKKVEEYDIEGFIEKPFNLEEFEAIFEILKKRK